MATDYSPPATGDRRTVVSPEAEHRDPRYYQKRHTLVEWHEELYRLLEQFDALSRKHKAQYWIDFGTLLGAYRHGRIIPWDVDVDVTMRYEEFLKLPIRVETDEYVFERSSHYTHRDPLETVGGRMVSKRCGAYLDVFVLKHNDATDRWEYHECPVFRRSEKGLWCIAPASRFFPLKTITLRGKEYPCPNRVRQHLDWRYTDALNLPPGMKEWLGDRERRRLQSRDSWPTDLSL